MSNLPSAVYTTALMITAGKTLVIASTGTSYGNYTRARVPIFSDDFLSEVSGSNGSTSALPNATLGTAAMVTAGKTLVLATSGTSWGHYKHKRKYVIATVGALNPIALSITGDAISLSDSAAFVVLTPLFEAVSDSLSLTDATAYNLAANVSELLSDTITLSDSTAYTLAVSGDFAILLGDSLSFSDSVTVLVFSGPPATAGVTQVLIEVAPHAEQGHGPPNIIVTQDAIEWVRHPSDNILATQNAIEFLFHPPDSIIGTQVCIEVAHKPYPAVPVKAHYKRFFPIRK